MSVLLSLTTATTTTLGAVTATASMVTSTINSAAAMAQVMELNALAYRDDQMSLIKSTREQSRLIGRQQAGINVTTRLVEINKQLADPEFKSIYDQVMIELDAA